MAESSYWTSLHAQLHQTLRQRQLLAKRERVLIAVSGGQDSLCLSKLLSDLQPKWQWQLGIAHCDHGWASDVGIAAWVKQFTQTLDLPFYLKTTTGLKETEAAARQWRYGALIEIAREENFQFVVTGHTKTDLGETLLYNLLRGSGTDGLQSLSWQRPLSKDIQLIRPLLNISRPETLQFCQQFQLPIWEDEVNQNLRYARNRIRQELIPYLKTHFNPQVETALAQTAEVLRAEVEYQEQVVTTLYKKVAQEPRKINRRELKNSPLAIQRRVMRQFLQTYLPSAPTFGQIEALTNLISAPNRSQTSSLPGGAIAKVQQNEIILEFLTDN
ncbi:MAG: tRNA lysidine(34) synthetase TilS [Spirulinaceae cyanobacterium]